jgi:hypothetical protein
MPVAVRIRVPSLDPMTPVTPDPMPHIGEAAAAAIPVRTSPPGPRVELLQAAADETLPRLRELTRARGEAFGDGLRFSRAYAFPYALLAAHDDSVGIAIERVAPRDVVFAASICTPAELERVRVLDWTRMTSLWASKVAFAKARGDARLYDPRRLDGPDGWAGGTSGPWCAEPVAVGPAHRAWVCWRA